MTMFAEDVITSKLFYGFVNLAKNLDLRVNTVFLKFIEIEIQNCSLFCLSALRSSEYFCFIT
jgi:hypothetical protein